MIKFACSKCGKSIRVDDKYAGKKGKCPKCGNTVVVPDHSTLIEFHCDGCGHKIKVSQRHAGKKGKCPKCQASVVVPGAPAEPVEETGGASITCAMCGQAIDRTGNSAEQFLECPGCGSYLEASSGQLASGPEAAAPSETDEDLYEEPEPASEKAAGLDRRLVIIIASAAAVVVLGLIGLVIFLRSSGPEPARPPVAARPPRETAQTEPQPQPVVTDAPAPERSVAREAGDGVLLRFAPSPGKKKNIRVTTEVTVSTQMGDQQHDMLNTQSVAVELEPGEAQADGTIPIQVTLAQIQAKTGTQNQSMEYDSAKPQSEADFLAGMYVPFVGKHFTIRVSDHGEIVDPGLDELFLAVAVDRIETENDMMRTQLKEQAAEAIEMMDQRFGSRRQRTVTAKQQLEDSPVFGREELLSLLGHVVAPLPSQPVRNGASWDGPVAVRVGTNLKIPGTHTAAAIGEDACTIDARGERSEDEEPFVYQRGNMTISSKLAGSSQIQLTIERPTGWLQRKEQKTTLSGRVLTVSADAPGQEISNQVALEITTTVAPAE